jgi:hypothetical protein
MPSVVCITMLGLLKFLARSLHRSDHRRGGSLIGVGRQRLYAERLSYLHCFVDVITLGDICERDIPVVDGPRCPRESYFSPKQFA